METIEDKLISGNINDKQASALLPTLEKAESLLDDGILHPVCHLLGAFIKQVEAMIRSG